MKQVSEVCKIARISKRTLQYYDKEGLLSPTDYTESGYRLYDDNAIQKLFKILLLKEIGYKLDDIKIIMNNPAIDLRQSIDEHIKALTMKRDRLSELIGYAKTIKFTGIVSRRFAYSGKEAYSAFIEKSIKQWNISERPDDSADFDLFTIMRTIANEKVYRIFEIDSEDELDKYLIELEDSMTEEEAKEFDDFTKNMDRFFAFFEGKEDEFNESFNLLREIKSFVEEKEDVKSKKVQNHIKQIHAWLNKIEGKEFSLNDVSLWGQMISSGGDYGVFLKRLLGEDAINYLIKAIYVYCGNKQIKPTKLDKI